MDRSEWIKEVRNRAEQLYDQISPKYWVTFGLTENKTHLTYLQDFLNRLPRGGTILSAACGAGRYDGILLEAGHGVIGIDLSGGMLERAKQYFPRVDYRKMALQDMNFQGLFEGIICMDAMEHIFPEDYPGILHAFQQALKPGGYLYFTADRAEAADFDLQVYYELGLALGLPVVFGEVAQEAIEQRVMENLVVPEEGSDPVYHYYPPLAQVRTWIDQAGLEVEREGDGSGFHHFLLKKK